jgi:hypothetical protein
MVETSGPWEKCSQGRAQTIAKLLIQLEAKSNRRQILTRIVIDPRQNLGKCKAVLEVSACRLLKNWEELVAGGGIEPPTLGL